MPIERKLATIMFTDIVGYTAQMSKDEAVAISLLNKKESILKPLIAKNKGTYVKSTGDGSLSYFSSAVDATTCAKRFQESIYDDKDLNVRVGVHLGETIFEGGDVKGDSVNGAARIESMAIVGGVFVSREVFDQLRNKKEFDGISIGLQQLKGLGRLIEVFGLKGEKLNEPNPEDYTESCCPTCDCKKEVPSIAIMQFRNKGKKKDEFFSYGICSELISDVSSAGLIRVASKKQIEDAGELPIDELAKKVDVRYIANGELWRMGEIFHLSIELYDSKEKRVIWSDNWQEKWDNLPMIKGNLSDGILKVLNTKPMADKKVDTSDTKAYEYYLKGKYKFGNRENMEDIEIGRGLLQKAINLDDNLIAAKITLGWTYFMMSNYDKAMGIYSTALIKAEELDDKNGIIICYRFIGNTYFHKGDYDKALDYQTRALKIEEEIGTNSQVFLVDIGNIYFRKGDYDKALECFISDLKKLENLGNIYMWNLRITLSNIGKVYQDKGDFDKAMHYKKRALKIAEEVGTKSELGYSLSDIGMVYYHKGNYDKAVELLKESLPIINETIGADDLIRSVTYLYLAYKHLGKAYDENKIHSLIKEIKNIEFEVNYRLFQLLEDTSYLETAYNQVQDKADKMEKKLAAKFLSYPIPKAIVEEWEKVK